MASPRSIGKDMPTTGWDHSYPKSEIIKYNLAFYHTLIQIHIDVMSCVPFGERLKSTGYRRLTCRDFTMMSREPSIPVFI